MGTATGVWGCCDGLGHQTLPWVGADPRMTVTPLSSPLH